MRRSRLILIAILALAIAFAWTVQRDTFIRRWLLPASVARQPVPDLRLENADVLTALRRLSVATAVDIECNQIIPESDLRDLRPVTLDLRGQTLEQAILAIFKAAGVTQIRVMELPDGRTIRLLRSCFPSQETPVVRVYDAARIIPQDDSVFDRSGGFVQTRRQAAAAELRERALCIPHFAGIVEPKQATFQFGDRMVVFDRPHIQRVIASELARMKPITLADDEEPWH